MDNVTIILFVVIVSSLIINMYFIEDEYLQARIAYIALTFSLFFFALESLIRAIYTFNKGLKYIASLWLTIFLLDDFIGVCMGYTLNTKYFIQTLFLTAVFCVLHIIVNRIKK